MSEDLKLRFGDLEAVLAALNGIPSHQRTAFQARLKNFHRLGFPEGVGQGRGRAAIYGAREVVLMAIAIELTQLGLRPERVIEVITDDELPVWMCVGMAAYALKSRPEVFNPGPGDAGNPADQKVWGFSARWTDLEDVDPFSMFLFCDPAALAPIDEETDWDRASASFFYGGAAHVRENITRWTTGHIRRLALINVTKLLFDIAAYLAGENGLKVVDQFEAVANKWNSRADFDLDEWLVTVARRMMMIVAAGPKVPHIDQFEESSPWIWLNDLLADLPKDHDFRRITVFPEQGKVDGLTDRAIPDMIIRLPGQRQLMVDAKIYPTADIPQDGILSRVEELARQPYKTQFTDRTDHIVLYVPSERFYEQAVAADKHIFERGLDAKVLIVSPAVLLNLLAEAATAWDRYRAEFPDIGNEEFEGLSEETLASLDPNASSDSILPPRSGAKHGRSDNGDDQEA